MAVDPRTPIVVGVGQVTHRPGPQSVTDTPVDATSLMAEAVELAMNDTGGRRPQRVDLLAVVNTHTGRYR
ncbi:MAG: hypothetical protein VW964_04135, partial [Ilumatobacter sp.]